MSKYLCTFSGKYGDILWSLATARYISEVVVCQPVDFAVMPYYQNLLPLLIEQTYIQRAFIVEDWLRTHSNHGDQPWQPPKWLEEGGPYTYDKEQHGIKLDRQPYEKFWHLTYRGHPGISAPAMPLIDFIAYQQGINFQGWKPCPFIGVSDSVEEEALKIQFTTRSMKEVLKEKRLIAYSFNEQYEGVKAQFFQRLWGVAHDEFAFFDVSSVGWKEAAWLIKKSLVYVGDRSACWVLANGFGKQIITFEPHPSRHESGHLGKVFGNPYGKETALPFMWNGTVAADAAASLLRKIREEELENSCKLCGLPAVAKLEVAVCSHHTELSFAAERQLVAHRMEVK